MTRTSHPAPRRRLTRNLSISVAPAPWGLWAAAGLALVGVACGSVGGGLQQPEDSGAGGAVPTDAGGDRPQGTGGTAGSDAGGSVGGSAGTTGVDAAVDQIRTDGASDAVDAAPLPTSCFQIKQQNPAAVSGVFTIAPLGTAQNVFCEMTVDNGGWTAFYVGDNGTPPGAAHFEGAADACADPANQCIRRLPVNVDATRDFAVKCGASVVKFKLGALALDYFRNGLEHAWQPLTNAVTIDVGVVGKANLVVWLWTGLPDNLGWIVAGSQSDGTSAFANGYTTNGVWNYCNGSTQPDASSRVMLFYR